MARKKDRPKQQDEAEEGTGEGNERRPHRPSLLDFLARRESQGNGVAKRRVVRRKKKAVRKVSRKKKAARKVRKKKIR